MEGYTQRHFTIPIDLTSRSGFVTDYIAINVSNIPGRGGDCSDLILNTIILFVWVY